MKKAFILLILFILTIACYTFFHKNYLKFELAGEIPNINNEYYPDAYQFFHSDSELQSYFTMNKDTKQQRESAKHIIFDFKNYSYVVVYGRKIKAMYNSHKASTFDDISPSYSQPSGRVVVFVEYEDASKGKGIYFYRVPKDIRLRGFFGV